MKALLYKVKEKSILSNYSYNRSLTIEDITKRSFPYDRVDFNSMVEIFLGMKESKNRLYEYKHSDYVAYYSTEGLIFRVRRARFTGEYDKVDIIGAFVSDKDVSSLGVIIPRDSFEVWFNIETPVQDSISFSSFISVSRDIFIEDNYMNVIKKNVKEMSILIKSMIKPIKSLDKQLEADQLLLKEALLNI